MGKRKRSYQAYVRREDESNKKAAIKRTTARIVSTNSHRDREKSESVNNLTPGQVLAELIGKLPHYRTSTLLPATEFFEKGEIISDSRGTGSQQGVIII